MSYSAGDSQNSAKFTAKGAGAKFSIFDVLNAGPQVAASFVSSGYENVPPGPVQGPSNKPQELEWDKAEKGELQEKSELDFVPEAGPSTALKEGEEKEEEEEAPYERPPMDVFKAIFADSESESEEEEEEEKKEEPQKRTEVPRFTQKVEQPKPPVEEEDDDAYGPQLPMSTTVKVATVSLATTIQAVDNQEEWVEKDKKSKKKKEKKKKSKKKKDKKNKKRKRHHSDSSSSSSDDEVDDVKILKKIATLKKLKKI